MVLISLNQPTNIVEKKVPELERWDSFCAHQSSSFPDVSRCRLRVLFFSRLRSLGAALDWTIHIMEVQSGGALVSRSVRAAMTTVSFISLDKDEVVPAEKVIE